MVVAQDVVHRPETTILPRCICYHASRDVLAWVARWCQTSAVECSEPTWIRFEGAAASPVGHEIHDAEVVSWPYTWKIYQLAIGWTILGTSSQAVLWKFGLLGSLLQPKNVHQIREDTPASKAHTAYHMITSLSWNIKLGVGLLTEEVKELTLVDIDRGC